MEQFLLNPFALPNSYARISQREHELTRKEQRSIRQKAEIRQRKMQQLTKKVSLAENMAGAMPVIREDQDVRPGDWILLDNTRYVRKGSFLRENAIYLGKGRLYAHPFGAIAVEEYKNEVHKVTKKPLNLINQQTQIFIRHK